MAARRRDHIPPYEIMGRRAPGASGGPAAAPGNAGTPDTPLSGSSSAGADSAGMASDVAADLPGGSWWTGSSGAIILRVPRGLAVIALAGVIGLLVLAYFVGYLSGDSAGATRVRAQFDGGPDAIARHAPPAIPQGASGSNPGITAAGRQPGAGAGAGAKSQPDPRQKGLNYLILQTYPPDWAKRLKAFMGKHGVETILNPVNNGQKFQVIATGKGFSASQLDSRRKHEFESHMRQLGRAWRKYNNNSGDTLDSMYFAKYDG